MSARKPLRVSGLLDAAKANFDPNREMVDLHAATRRAEPVEPAQITTDSVSTITTILLAQIDDSPYQPRMHYDPVEIDNLAHSLAAAGIEDPIMVRAKPDGRYELIGGHRRTRAARSLGWTDISANIVAKDDRQAELATMVQNEARVDLTDYERGKLYQAAMTSGFGKTQADIANLFGCSQPRVSKCMSMLKLPDAYRKLLDAAPDLFGANCAETILSLLKEYPDEHVLIEEAVHRISHEGADQKSVRQWMQQMIKQKEGLAKPKARAVVTDRAGQELFVLRPAGREMTVQIKMPQMDSKVVEEAVLMALRKLAEMPPD